MANLWRYWGVKDLTQLLNSQNPSLLPSLEKMLPSLVGEEFNPADLYLRDNLVKIAISFLPSQAFTSVEFRTACLDRLPPAELRACARAVDVGVDTPDFAERRDVIGRQRWTGTFAQDFVNHFELPHHFLPTMTEVLPSHQDLDPPSVTSPVRIRSRFKQLKSFQFRVYEDAAHRLTAPRSRFVIQMPTGSGKTRTCMETVSEVLNATPGLPVVIWLAHSEELCEQGLQCFLDVWPHLASKPLRAHRCWGKHDLPHLAENRASFIVAGFQKLYATINKDANALSELQSRCALIVVDEAHKTEAPTYKQVIKALLGENACVIGLTATPGRTDREEVVNLADFYFNQIVELPCSDEHGVIEMLRSQGVLSYASYIPIISEIDVKLTPSQQRQLAERFELPKGLVADLGKNDVRNIEILKRLVSECRKERRILLFSCSVDHSKFLTSILLYLGYKAGHVDGSTESGRRRQLITEFKNGDLQVLCNFGVLSAGFDAPNTDVVFITRPTASPVLYSQMIGRGLRGPKIGGTETCTIIDVRDNIIGFGDADQVYTLFEEYWVN